MQIADFIFYFSPDQKLYEMHCIIKNPGALNIENWSTC